MSNSSAQPYLDWLDHDADPPARLSLRGWQLAGGELIARMRQARKRLVDGVGQWHDFEQMLIDDYKFESLNLWAKHTHERTPGTHKNSFIPNELRLRKARMRFLRGSGRSRAIHVLRGWLRRRKHPLSGEQKRMVRAVIEEWRGALEGRLRPETEKLTAQHFRRSNEYSRECKERGVWLTRRQAQELDPVWRKRARQQAKAQGYDGWFITADDDDGKRALECISDRGLREALWRQRQALRENDTTVSRMLQARHREAQECSQNSYAHLALFDRTLTSPRQVQGILSEHLDALRASIQRVERRVAAEAHQWGIENVQPWDRTFLLEQLRRKMRFFEEPKDVFHIERTLEVLVPELMALGGWKIDSALLHGEGGSRQWQYRMLRKDGARAQMWIAPFETNDNADLNEAAYHQFVQSRWSGGGKAPTMLSIVAMYLSRKSNHFDHTQLVWLIHEIGHALHYLAMRGCQHDESTTFPDDLIEFPSQLLERYAQDPKVLARLATISGGPEVTRHPAFWRDHLATQLRSFNDHIRFTYSAWMDMTVHRMAPEKVSLQEMNRMGCERFGLPYHEDDRDHFRYFMWGDYAATDYAYPLGLALGNELAPRREDGTIDAQIMGYNYSVLLEGVLNEGVDPRRLKRCWQQQMGEDVATSLRRGMKKQATYMRMLSRAIERLP